MLTLPPKFKQALGNGTRTSLYPLVRIYKGVQIDDPITDETESINLSIKETNIGGEAYKGLLLNSPSISSKADIINNKYTISSVSLSISNAPYNGKIFSDDIPSLLNAVVQVYYAANGLETLDDCLLVYTGTIRRYSQSAETLNLTLEDLTEQKLKTQIPSTLIDDADSYTDEQLGQPYPMVYGYVDKSPVILNKFDSLAIDKPDIEIKGIWSKISKINYQNEYMNNQNYLISTGFLKENSFLYIYNNAYLPITEEMPTYFGSRPYDFIDGPMYTFESNVSPQINLNSNNFLYEEYHEVITEEDDQEVTTKEGKGNVGIPTRIYRPVVKVSFFANNRDVWDFSSDSEHYYFAGSSNKFFGFSNENNLGMSKSINNRSLESDSDTNENINNIPSNADDLYDNNWNELNEEGLFSWWKTTELNDASGTDDEDGIFDDKDLNWQGEGVNAQFPVNWIQNNDDKSGICMDSQLRQDKEGGSYARLEFNTDVASFPCVTKIFYYIDYFAPLNIDTQVGDDIEAEPTAFWVERNLIERKRNDVDRFHKITEKNNWEVNYDEEDWITYCEVPNAQHDFDDSNINNDFRVSTLGAINDLNDYHNIILNFGSTDSYDSIQWGVPQLLGNTNKISSCIANLKQFYVTQDVLATEYTTQDYYASIKGRVDNNENLISKSQDILQNILEKELNFGKDIVMPETDDDYIHSFSMNEQQEAKSVIENLFKSSVYIPSFDSTGNFKIIDLKQNIEDYEQFEVIDNLDIIKYSFGLTKLEDVKNQINVKYKKDYGSGDFAEETTYSIEDNNGNFVDTLDDLTQELTPNMLYELNYYGMKDEDAKLEIESEYIRDKDTARKLQRRLLMWYANQHLTMKLDLPPSYMHLEAGDYLRFDELIGGKLAFGFDYTQEFVKNGQLIYPVFFVTKVAKSLSKVSLELVQVHRGDFGMSDDDLGFYNVPNPYERDIYQDEVIDEEDTYFEGSWYQSNNNLHSGFISAITNTNYETGIEYELNLVFVNANISYDGEPLTNGMDATNLVNSYIVENNSIYGDNVDISIKLNNENVEFLDDNTQATLLYKLKVKSNINDDFYELQFSQTINKNVVFNGLYGDVNQDGILNVLDVVGIVGSIVAATTDNYPKDEDGRNIADITNDGLVNVLDIVTLVNQILGN
jgi:hypothetical protein